MCRSACGCGGGGAVEAGSLRLLLAASYDSLVPVMTAVCECNWPCWVLGRRCCLVPQGAALWLAARGEGELLQLPGEEAAASAAVDGEEGAGSLQLQRLTNMS